MSGAGDAANRDRGEEEEASAEGAVAMPEEGGIAARRDSHVAAITFLGALKIPVSNSD